MTNEYILEAVGFLASQLQQSVDNPDEQTTNNLTRIDTGLANVAAFAESNTTEVITESVSETLMVTFQQFRDNQQP